MKGKTRQGTRRRPEQPLVAQACVGTLCTKEEVAAELAESTLAPHMLQTFELRRVLWEAVAHVRSTPI